jgi:flagellar basal body-associated protein FliL
VFIIIIIIIIIILIIIIVMALGFGVSTMNSKERGCLYRRLGGQEWMKREDCEWRMKKRGRML